MLPKEIIKKIRHIEIYTAHLVNDLLAGEYHSVFKGRGMDFAEVREYQMGDDIRTIDWNVTARTGHPHVKQYVEERELTVMLLVDASSSGEFGTVRQMKGEIAVELCALLAFSAIKNNDKVGLIVFTDQVEMFIPPAKGTTHVLRLIRELLDFKPKQTQTNITAGIEYLGKVTTKKSVVFLVSDFLGQGFENQLRVLGKRHDLIAVSITDPREIKMPNIGLVELEDAETGEMIMIDTGSRSIRSQYEKLGSENQDQLRSLFRSMDVDHIEIFTDRNYVQDLVKFFKSRERRIQR